MVGIFWLERQWRRD